MGGSNDRPKNLLYVVQTLPEALRILFEFLGCEVEYRFSQLPCDLHAEQNRCHPLLKYIKARASYCLKNFIKASGHLEKSSCVVPGAIDPLTMPWNLSSDACRRVIDRPISACSLDLI